MNSFPLINHSFTHIFYTKYYRCFTSVRRPARRLIFFKIRLQIVGVKSKIWENRFLVDSMANSNQLSESYYCIGLDRDRYVGNIKRLNSHYFRVIYRERKSSHPVPTKRIVFASEIVLKTVIINNAPKRWFFYANIVSADRLATGRTDE